MLFYDADNFNPDHSIGYLVRRAHQLGVAALDGVFAEYGLTGTQWSTLIMLLAGKCETCVALARDLAHDKGAMTRLIDQLDERGLVVRERISDDRRQVRVSLTPAGVDLAERSRRAVLARWNDWLADWPRQDVDTLVALLRRLDATLEAAEAANAAG